MKLSQHPRGAGVSHRRRRPRRLGFEGLEERSLLSGFLVNSSFTTDDQSAPSVAINPSTGASVAVWQSRFQYSPNSGYDIYAQLYNPNGTPNGGAFLVNTTTANDQMRPSVSMNASGNFVVTWQSMNQVSSNSAYDVVGRFYLAGVGGYTSSPEFVVNTTATASQTSPAVALNANNQFTVTWMSEGQGPTQLGSGGDGSGGGGGGTGAGAFAGTSGGAALSGIIMNIQGVMAQQFQATGTTVSKYGTTEVVVNSFQSSPEGFIQKPSVGIDSGGNFAVAFSAEDANAVFNGVAYDEDYAYARRFHNGGAPIDSRQVIVNHNPGDNADGATIAVNPSGKIVIAWAGSLQGAAPGLHSGVFAQLWSISSLTNPGGVITVSPQNTIADKGAPRVSINSAGTFEVVWVYNHQSDGGGDVFARQFGATGSPLTGEIKVNDNGAASNTAPVVALDDAGNFFVAWEEPDSPGSLAKNIWGRFF